MQRIYVCDGLEPMWTSKTLSKAGCLSRVTLTLQSSSILHNSHTFTNKDPHIRLSIRACCPLESPPPPHPAFLSLYSRHNWWLLFLQRSIIAHSCCCKSERLQPYARSTKMSSSFRPHMVTAVVKHWGWWWCWLLVISSAVCMSSKEEEEGRCCSLFLCLLQAGWIVCPQVTVWITWLIVFQLLIN